MQISAKQFENPLGFLHKQSIIEVVVKANRLISPSEIQKELNKLNKNSYQIGQNWNWEQIKNNKTENRYLPQVTQEKETKKKQNNILSLRSIQTHCKDLVNQKIFEHEYNRYRISDKANLLDFSMMFGKYALLSLMQNMKLSNLDHDNLHKFVNLFGSLILFVFIEATTTRNNDNMVINWIEHAIPLKLMFDYFISVFTNESELKDKIKTKSSLYEFDKEKIKELSETLKTINPEAHKLLTEAKRSLLS